jgi:hypothetical protein
MIIGPEEDVLEASLKRYARSGIVWILGSENCRYYGGHCFAIPVSQATVDAFRNDIQLTREAPLNWVPEEIDVTASQVYELLRAPMCSGEYKWFPLHQGQTPMHLDSRCLWGMFSAGRELVDKRPIKVLVKPMQLLRSL